MLKLRPERSQPAKQLTTLLNESIILQTIDRKIYLRFHWSGSVDTEQLRTFLAVEASGSFLEAASRVHVTQSTVSARIQSLENYLGASLFVRNRAGAVLTPAGRRFLRHAKNLVLTIEQSRHDVGLPSRFRASITLGARIALWDDFLPRWAGHMRERAPDVSIRSEVGLEDDLLRRLVEGTMDLALMYTPQHGGGFFVEHLFDETMVLISSNPQYAHQDDTYIYIDWGPSFDAQYLAAYPDVERPAQLANIGWLALQLVLVNGGACFVPERMSSPYVNVRRLHLVPDSPRFRLPAYVVYPLENSSPEVQLALAALRTLAAAQR
jgi:DNA-binding transcriptional LysR family regulator